MLRNKNVTLTFLLAKDVSLMIRIINDTSLISLEHQKKTGYNIQPFQLYKTIYVNYALQCTPQFG